TSRSGTGPALRRTVDSSGGASRSSPRSGRAGGRPGEARSRSPGLVRANIAAGFDLEKVALEMAAPILRRLDHRFESGNLAAQRRDLPVDPGNAVMEHSAALSSASAGAEPRSIRGACRLVLEQLADLGQA